MNWYKLSNINVQSNIQRDMIRIYSGSSYSMDSVLDLIKKYLMAGVSVAVILSTISSFLDEKQMDLIKKQIPNIQMQITRENPKSNQVEEESNNNNEEIVKNPKAINTAELYEQLKLNEGVRYVSYYDTKGKRTIGIGFNMDRSGAKEFAMRELGINELQWNDLYKGKSKLNENQVMTLFSQDLEDSIAYSRKWLPNFEDQPTEVKHVVIDMMFNMGYNKMQEFSNLKKALMNNDYKSAALEMKYSSPEKKKLSPWWNQTGDRAKRLFNQMYNYTE